MNRTVTKGILWVVASFAAIAMLATPAAARGRRHQACLAPDGTDNTAQVESALKRCSGARRGCVVSLCEGTFRIAPVRVENFRGVLRGAGREKTFLQALPNLEVNDNPFGYFLDDPFDEDLAPWPVLVQFIGGKGRLHDFTVEIPSPPSGERPTQGWLDGLIYELDGAILITGRESVDFEVKRVGVVAGDDLLSEIRTTLLNGISFEGRLFNREDPDQDGYPVFPLRGRFRLTESKLVGMLSGSSAAELLRARVTVANNDYRSGFAMFVQDADRSHVRILGNRWETQYSGLQVFLNFDGRLSERNSFLVYGNQGTTDVAFPDWLGFGVGHGVVFIDPWVETREPGGSVVSLARNELSVRTVAGPALSGIDVSGAGRLWTWKNVVRGQASLGGINVDRTSGCWLARNALGTTGGPDLALGPDTRRCLAVVDHGDRVVDQGTGNWILFR
jgi:hypothetical protein